MDSDEEECFQLQQCEMEALEAIYGGADGAFVYELDEESNRFKGTISIEINDQVAEKFVSHVADEQGSIEWKTIKHLPPIQLSFSLPPLYPLKEPPQLSSLQCTWLPADELESTVQKLLDQTWEIESGMTVLDILINSIQYELAPSGRLSISIAQGSKKGILDYNGQKLQEEFESNTYSCIICMEEQSGRHCIKLSACSHVYCQRCLGEYLRILIKEGNLHAIRCPNPECTNPRIGDKDLELLLDEESMDRFRKLVERRKVETDNENYAWCPRKGCNKAAKRDRVLEKLCICECGFAFCLFCRKVWHGTNYCQIENKVKIVERYRRAKEQDKKMVYLQMEQQYGIGVLQKMLEEYEMEEESMNFIKESTQQCPTCQLPITKSFGCNHMRCTQCDTHFCYLCGSYIDKHNPMLHFNVRGSGCHMRLFEGIIEDTDDIDRDAAVAQAEEDEANLMIRLALGDDE
ncbi:hypothetical protein GGI12_002001 [Dipsacomyces acuminosporus]|nr:hypothetical protein GGI12_002001 [Dipsacomyces acuminosporus]